MLDNAILLKNGIQHFKRTAAVDHEIFRNDFKPVDYRLVRQDMPVVGNAKTNTNPVVGETVERICGHGEEGFGSAGSPENRTPASSVYLSRETRVSCS